MFNWGKNKYQELEEQPAVLTPLRPTSMLQPSHFSTPLQQLKYPVKLYLSHERFRLRSLSLLTQLKETALQHIDLTDNELQSLSELNRFIALKTLIACRNMLRSGPGVNFSMHRLTRLDLSINQLSEMPQLKDLVLLQARAQDTIPRVRSARRRVSRVQGDEPTSAVLCLRCSTSAGTTSALAGMSSSTVWGCRRSMRRTIS